MKHDSARISRKAASLRQLLMSWKFKLNCILGELCFSAHASGREELKWRSLCFQTTQTNSDSESLSHWQQPINWTLKCVLKSSCGVSWVCLCWVTRLSLIFLRWLCSVFGEFKDSRKFVATKPIYWSINVNQIEKACRNVDHHECLSSHQEMAERVETRKYRQNGAPKRQTLESSESSSIIAKCISSMAAIGLPWVVSSFISKTGHHFWWKMFAQTSTQVGWQFNRLGQFIVRLGHLILQIEWHHWRTRNDCFPWGISPCKG